MAFEFPFGSGDKDGVDGHHEYLEVMDCKSMNMLIFLQEMLLRKTNFPFSEA